MTTVQAGLHLELKNLVYLTDFSESSAKALPFAVALARDYGAKIHAVHVLTLEPYMYMTPGIAAPVTQEREHIVQSRFRQLEAQLSGLPHEMLLERNVEVWPALEGILKNESIDLIVLGTRGRTGAAKLFLGSVAEQIFRRSSVPVLTIGPMMREDGAATTKFQNILYATDFKKESLAAASYAISLAHEHEAHLFLLHVVRYPERHKDRIFSDLSIADAMHQLYELVPRDADLQYRPKALVEHGEPAEQILEAAEQRDADLIVLGLRRGVGHLSATTHIGWSTAHRVVAHATCPVLTVRS